MASPSLRSPPCHQHTFKECKQRDNVGSLGMLFSPRVVLPQGFSSLKCPHCLMSLLSPNRSISWGSQRNQVLIAHSLSIWKSPDSLFTPWSKGNSWNRGIKEDPWAKICDLETLGGSWGWQGGAPGPSLCSSHEAHPGQPSMSGSQDHTFVTILCSHSMCWADFRLGFRDYSAQQQTQHAACRLHDPRQSTSIWVPTPRTWGTPQPQQQCYPSPGPARPHPQPCHLLQNSKKRHPELLGIKPIPHLKYRSISMPWPQTTFPSCCPLPLSCGSQRYRGNRMWTSSLNHQMHLPFSGSTKDQPFRNSETTDDEEKIYMGISKALKESSRAYYRYCVSVTHCRLSFCRQLKVHRI